MASFSAVRTGLQTRLLTITGLSAYDVGPGQVNVPAAIVLPGKPLIEFDESMARGSDKMRLRVMILAQLAEMPLAQDNLDVYLAGSGPGSVKAAIEGGPTLGGIVSYTWVSEVSEYGQITYNDVEYLGAVFEVEVMT